MWGSGILFDRNEDKNSICLGPSTLAWRKVAHTPKYYYNLLKTYLY